MNKSRLWNWFKTLEKAVVNLWNRLTVVPGGASLLVCLWFTSFAIGQQPGDQVNHQAAVRLPTPDVRLAPQQDLKNLDLQSGPLESLPSLPTRSRVAAGSIDPAKLESLPPLPGTGNSNLGLSPIPTNRTTMLPANSPAVVATIGPLGSVNEVDFLGEFQRAYAKIGEPSNNPLSGSAASVTGPTANSFQLPTGTPGATGLTLANQGIANLSNLASGKELQDGPEVPVRLPLETKSLDAMATAAASKGNPQANTVSNSLPGGDRLQFDRSKVAESERQEMPDNVAPSFVPQSGSQSPVRSLDLLTSDNDDATWWRTLVLEPLNQANETMATDTQLLVYQALKNSPRIQAISQDPLIRELQIVQAEAGFDPVGFVRTNYNDRNDPVGNTLVTGGPPFLQDHIWNGDIGVRKKTRTGGEIDLSQRLGFQNSNSVFFAPQDQGTATLALNVSQPLLRGRGRYINESQILIAQANSGAAWDTFVNELQNELEAVVVAYWRLYFDRSLFLQKQRNVLRGEQILEILNARSELDSLPSQIARANSAVETRKTELANAFRNVRNSETEIRRRVAERDWLVAQTIEILPSEMPTVEDTTLTLEQVVNTALENRREIKESLQQAKISSIQLEISHNEMLPELTFLIGGYVSALNGETGIPESFANQFANKPGYNAGLQFEMPYQNRAARSQFAQQRLQVARIKAEVEETLQMVIAESQIAHRRVNSAVQTRNAAYVAITAARQDLTQQTKRWEAFGLIEGDWSEGQNPAVLLNQVLDSQERLAAAELIFAQAELELKTSEVSLLRAMGTLLIHREIDYQMLVSGDNPAVDFNNSDSQPQPANLLPVEQEDVLDQAPPQPPIESELREGLSQD